MRTRMRGIISAFVGTTECGVRVVKIYNMYRQRNAAITPRTRHIPSATAAVAYVKERLC
jgi:hypothetical protein